MNNTMKNLKDEIEGIDEFVEYFLDGVDCLVNLDSMDYGGEKILRAGAKRELASLIEQEKERAVEEFHNFVRSNTLGGRFMDDGGGYFNADAVLREDIEQYLAERKG